MSTTRHAPVPTTPSRTHRTARLSVVLTAALVLATLLVACGGDTSGAVPTAPTITGVTPGDGTLTLAFDPGAGPPSVVAHEVSLDDGATWSQPGGDSAASPVALDGLTNGDVYPLRLRALNARGAGAASAAVRAMPLTPRFAIGTTGNGRAWPYDAATLADGAVVVAGEVDVSTFGAFDVDVGFQPTAFVTRVGGAGTWEWVSTPVRDHSARALTIDATHDGGAVVAGTYHMPITFGDTTLEGSDERTMFVAWIDANGVWTRARRATATRNIVPRGVAAQDDGGVIVVGSFQDAASFGEHTVTSTGGDRLFVARIDPTGDWDWATASQGDLGPHAARAVVALPDGGAIVIAELSAGPVSFGTIDVDVVGFTGIAVASLDASGAWRWVTTAGVAGGSASVSALARLEDGSVAIGGGAPDGMTFGSTVITATFDTEAFVARVDPDDGAWLWAAATVSSDDPSRTLRIDQLPSGDLVALGEFRYGLSAPGITDGLYLDDWAPFVATLDVADGAWRTLTGPLDTTNDIEPYGLAVQGDGGVVITGLFSGLVTFGSTTLTATEGYDGAFVAKLGPDGAW